MKTLILALIPIFSFAAAPDLREQTAEMLARQALAARDAEAVLTSCSFKKLISDGVFTCYSANVGPSATCEDNSRSAPFYIVEGFLDVELQPRISEVLFYEACSGTRE